MFVSVLFLHSSLLAHLFTDIIDQFCGSYSHRHFHLSNRQRRSAQQPEDVHRGWGVYLIGCPKFIMLNHIQIWCGGAALCDIVIAICMTYYVSSISLSVISIDVDTILQLTRSTAHFRRTQMLVTKVVRLTIETGSVTGIYSAPSAVVRMILTLTSSCYRPAYLHPFYCTPPSKFLHDFLLDRP